MLGYWSLVHGAWKKGHRSAHHSHEESASLLEKEASRYPLMGLTLMHSLCSVTSLIERGWTLFSAGVAPGERRRIGVVIFNYLLVCWSLNLCVRLLFLCTFG